MIGIDFDNTIACYENVFYEAALIRGLIPKELGRSKGVIRDYLRSIGKEDAWTELQGYVYGCRMDLAQPYPGLQHFLQACFALKMTPFIISHRTRFPYLGPRYNLHEAAKEWLQKQPFPEKPEAFFEETLEKKLERISKQKCTVFIDDLPEVLTHPQFPSEVRKILFDPHHLYPKVSNYERATSWEEICRLLGVFHDA